ncbi:hypothetical protein CGL56_07870 [Neolewinella marina]|uniref:Uncharacterized protein n=2 Tax=Neolewinella marina TaxID=438751 RepID=A0A2G0CHA6_9BACT|nr:hypothetical protein CGL56_07870 [Neolewinella marina]
MELATPSELGHQFARLYRKWKEVAARDRSDLNHFKEPGTDWTNEQLRAIYELEVNCRALAYRRLASFFLRLAGENVVKAFDPKSGELIVPETGEVFATNLPEGIEARHVTHPPLDYVGRWRLMEEYSHPDLKLRLRNAWRRGEAAGEIGLEWPTPPTHFVTYLEELTQSEAPHLYLEGICGEDAEVALDYLQGELSARHWNLLAGGEPRETILPWHLSWEAVPEDYRPPLDDIERTKHLQALTALEATKRRVGVETWDRVAEIIRANWNLYPDNAKWSGISEQAILAGQCAHWKEVLAKYEDRPEVVEEQVAEFLSRWEQLLQQQQQIAHEKEVADNTPRDTKKVRDSGIVTQQREAEIARRNADHTYFMYSVYRDFLNDYLRAVGGATTKLQQPEESNGLLAYFDRITLNKVETALTELRWITENGKWLKKKNRLPILWDVIRMKGLFMGPTPTVQEFCPVAATHFHTNISDGSSRMPLYSLEDQKEDRVELHSAL